MPPSAHIRRRLAEQAATGPDGFALGDVALLLSTVNRPRIDAEPYRRHLRSLADEVSAYAGSETGLESRIEALRQVIAGRYGYICGDDEAAEPEDCDLTRVIDCRAGAPETLCLIYLDVADRLGWAARGVDFPPRMMVRLDADGGRALIDPADLGRHVAAEDLRALLKATQGMDAELTPEHYGDMDRRAVLLRLQQTAKLRYLRHDRLREALATVETTLAIDPGSPAPWREAGLLNARLDNVPAAVAALEEYLRHDEADLVRQRTAALLQELRGRMS
jgi:regulator of sirC expression with transglutaminase-like and TPR domain